MRRMPIVLVAILFALGLVTTARAKPPSWDTVKPGASRFKILKAFNNEAVLDKETGLVWETSPSTSASVWTSALPSCLSKTVGDRKGWRAPSAEELMSLVDPAQTNPALPQGHPFQGVQDVYYWSGNTYAFSDQFAPAVSFLSGMLGALLKDGSHPIWCVRGGQLGSDIR